MKTFARVVIGRNNVVKSVSYSYCHDIATAKKNLSHGGENKDKKSYHIAATVKGRDIIVRQGTPVPYFAKDFRIEDEAGNVFDNHYYSEFRDAEKMLLQLL